MKVSAINCTPIKPQVSFGQTDEKKSEDELKLDKCKQFADKVDDEYVKSSNVKKPVAAVVSVALAGLLAFATGKVIAQKAAVIGEKLKLNLPELLDKNLRSLSNGVTKAADKLKNDNPVTKSDKFKNMVGKTVTSAVNFGKSLYRKIAYSGVADDATVAVRQAKAFANLGGIAGIATAFPAVATRDNNDDGVSDILQTGQNAYTGAKTKMGQVMEKAGRFSELVDLLT